jgi:hypothetical protein
MIGSGWDSTVALPARTVAAAPPVAIVHVVEAGVASTLPAASSARTLKVCDRR